MSCTVSDLRDRWGKNGTIFHLFNNSKVNKMTFHVKQIKTIGRLENKAPNIDYNL